MKCEALVSLHIGVPAVYMDTVLLKQFWKENILPRLNIITAVAHSVVALGKRRLA